MQTPALNDIKKSLLSLEVQELSALCLRLAKYKKENKELLSYLLYEASNETQYIEDIKLEIDTRFDELKKAGAYQLTKQIRKILRHTAKHIKYSGNPATEAELLIHFCNKLKTFVTLPNPVTALIGIYYRQIEKSEKALSKLHEDLSYDFQKDLIDLRQINK